MPRTELSTIASITNDKIYYSLSFIKRTKGKANSFILRLDIGQLCEFDTKEITGFVLSKAC